MVYGSGWIFWQPAQIKKVRRVPFVEPASLKIISYKLYKPDPVAFMFITYTKVVIIYLPKQLLERVNLPTHRLGRAALYRLRGAPTYVAFQHARFTLLPGYPNRT